MKKYCFLLALIILLTAVTLTAIFLIKPVRIGDGSEYYALEIAWSETFLPYMTDASFSKYEEFQKTGQVEGLVPVSWFKEVFPVLIKEGTMDFPHFWFYSLLAATSTFPAKLLGLSISPNTSFMFLHYLFALLALFLSWKYFRVKGLICFIVVFFASPAVWFFFKVHTEFMTVALSYSAVVLLCRRKFALAGFLLSILATQNPTFAVPAALCFLFRLFPFHWKSFQTYEIILAFVSGFLAILHPLYYQTRFNVSTPQTLTGAAEISISNFNISHVWFVDPDIGLFPNWLIGALILILFSALFLFDRKKAIYFKRFGYLIIFYLVYLFISLLGQNSTANINHGGTVNISRYGLWYIALLVPPTLYLFNQILKNKSAKVLSICLLSLSVGANSIIYSPLKGEDYLDGTFISNWIQTHVPWLYTPPSEIMAERWPTGKFSYFRQIPDVVAGPGGNKILVKRNFSIPLRIDPNPYLLTLDPDQIQKMVLEKDERLQVLDKNWFIINAWKLSKKDFFAQQKQQRTFTFTDQNDDTRFLSKGWGSPEGWGTWSTEKKAAITLPPIAPMNDEFILDLEIVPYLAPGLSTQHISLHLNSHLLGTFDFQHEGVTPQPTHLKIPIPNEFLQENEPIILEFDISNPTAPHELNSNSTDTRKLGIGIFSLKLAEKQSPNNWQTITINNQQSMDRILLNGWYSPEEWGVWSKGNISTLAVSPHEISPDGYSVVFNIDKLQNRDEQIIEVFLGPNRLETWTLTENQPVLESVFIPSYMLNDERELILTFKTNSARPIDLGINKDERELGFALLSVSINSK